MKSAAYRWVRVISSKNTEGSIISLIGTTNSEDRDCGIDGLILRHKTQMHQARMESVFTGIFYMNSEGRMDSKEIFLLNPNNENQA